MVSKSGKINKAQISKKIMAYFLAAAMITTILSYTNIFSLAATVAEDGQLKIASVNFPGAVLVNETFEGTMTVINNSDSRVDDIFASIAISGASVTVSPSTTQKIDYLTSGEMQTVHFTCKLTGGNNGDIVKVNFQLRTGTDNSPAIDTAETSLKITGTQTPHFEVLSSTYPAAINTNNAGFKISLRFAARGTDIANAKVTLSPEKKDQYKFLSQEAWSVSLMEMNTSEYIEFSLAPNANITPGRHIFAVTLTGDKADIYSYDVEIFVEDASASPDDLKSPNIRIISSDIPASAEKESNIQIKAIIKNTGVEAKNITVTLKKLDGIEFGSKNIIQIDSLKKNEEKELIFDLIITDKAIDYYNLFEINIKYGDVSREHYIGLNIIPDGSSNKSDSDIQIISADIPASANREDTFKIKAVIKNIGGDAENITVTLKPPSNGGIVNTSSNIIQIASLKKGEEKQVEFDLLVTDSAADNYNLFELVAEHKDVSKIQYVGLNILAGETLEDANIEIVSDEIPASANREDAFKIKAVIKNTGGDAENITVTLKPPSNGGIVNTSSNIIQIASLKKGEEKEVEFDLFVTEDAADNYNLFELIAEHNKIAKSRYTGLNIPPKADEKAADEDITLTVELPQDIKYSEDFILKFTVKNNGIAKKNLMVVIPNPEGVANKTANTISIPELKADESVTHEVTFTANESIAGKHCLFQVSVYKKQADGADNLYASRYAGTNVGSIRQSKLAIDSVTIPNSTGINKDFQVSVKISNRGADASNIVLTLTPQSGVINKTSNIVKIDRLSENEGVDVTFTFMATETAANGFNSINIVLSPGDGTADINQYSGLIVSNPKKEEDKTPDEDSKLDVPVVMISRFDYGGEEVYGGRTFNFVIEFWNTHKQVAIKDLKITLSQEKGIFNPKSGSNTFFVEQLNPGETVEKEIELLVKNDATPDSYGLTVTLSYRNEEGEQATATEIINIPVQQETRFNVGDIPVINEIMMGDEAYVNIQFGNLGKSIIYNVVVKIESEMFFDMEGGYYAGNLEAGKNTNKAFYLTPNMPGYLTGKVVFEYENAAGEVTRDEHDISFMVMDDGSMDMGMNPDMGMFPEEGIEYDENGMPVMKMEGEVEEENKGFFKWLFTDMGWLQWVIIIGSVMIVIVLAVIGVVVVRRIRKKKEDIEDEDDA